jgi:hypothetical protein
MSEARSHPAGLLDLLSEGSLESQGLLPWSSNYTFLMRVCREETPPATMTEEEILAVYKPQRGERPLWDFASGTLCLRERAAFLLSEALGWGLVPATVLRDGPHGLGSLQWFVPHDPEAHYFTFEGQFVSQVQRVALFDVVVNNADRKGGHLLRDDGNRVWAIDHGICFHEHPKLRTVIWDYAGDPIPEAMLADLSVLAEILATPDEPRLAELLQLLSERELHALRQRLARLIGAARFPEPGPGRHYPWPLV